MQPKDQILARTYVVLTLLALLPLAVGAQVVWIHLTEGAELRRQGREQARTTVEVPAERGAILDRAGRTLARGEARYDLAVDPTTPGFASRRTLFFESLSKLTGTRAAHYRRRVAQRSSPQYVRLARGLGEEAALAVRSWRVPGVLLEPRYRRRYDYGTTAAHVLGHVDADLDGIAGVELQAQASLDGVPGQRAVARDRRGIVKALVGGEVVAPRHGETIVLTLDLIRQTILEEELARGVEAAGATWGTALAMDPHTGAILALANVPTYDPNRPGAFSTAERRNRAVTDQIEPGSTFKLVTAVAAVEQGVVALDDTVDTGAGWTVFHGRTMRDTHAHGEISFADVIARSSNVGTAKVATRLDPGVLYQYARNLGFGQPTWVDLPGEAGGTLHKPHTWSGTTPTSLAIGYAVDVTPLQLLTAYAALANGGLLMQPYLVAERRDAMGRTVWQARPDSVRRAFKRETAEALRPAFERVVEEGTARRARVEGLPVAGKTGTARKALGGRYEPGRYRASFAGFFPADDPKVALVVVLDDPQTSGYGGVVAAPIFARIARRWVGTFPEIAARLAPPDTLPAAPPPPLPVRRAALAGPPPGAATRAATRAATPDTGVAMPDLTGLSAREAAFRLGRLGVDVRIEGTGRVARQAPPAGQPLPDHATLECR